MTMKTTRSTLIKSIAATFATLMLTACGSDGGGGGGGSTGTSSISLTDAPIDEALDVTVRFDGVECVITAQHDRDRMALVSVRTSRRRHDLRGRPGLG